MIILVLVINILSVFSVCLASTFLSSIFSTFLLPYFFLISSSPEFDGRSPNDADSSHAAAGLFCADTNSTRADADAVANVDSTAKVDVAKLLIEAARREKSKESSEKKLYCKL